MNILTIGDLKKSYNDLTAVNGISLAVEEGEIRGIFENTIKRRVTLPTHSVPFRIFSCRDVTNGSKTASVK